MFSLYTSATIESAFVGVLRRSCLLPSDPVRSMVFRMSLLQCETGVPKMGSARQRRKEISFAEVNMIWAGGVDEMPNKC